VPFPGCVVTKRLVGTGVTGAVTVNADDVTPVSPAEVKRSVLEPVVPIDGTSAEKVAIPPDAMTLIVPPRVALPVKIAAEIVAVLENNAPNWSRTRTTTAGDIVAPEAVAVGCVVMLNDVAAGATPTVIVNAEVVAEVRPVEVSVSVQLVVLGADIGIVNVATPELFVLAVLPERMEPVPVVTLAVMVAVALNGAPNWSTIRATTVTLFPDVMSEGCVVMLIPEATGVATPPAVCVVPVSA
jgi:hypothetical protein